MSLSRYYTTKLHTEWIGRAISDHHSSSSSSKSGPVVFLHGLLGNGRNVRTMARRLCQQQSRAGLLVDLRGHGKSQPIPKEHAVKSSFASCSRDVHLTLQDAGVKAEEENLMLVGHSLGGRLSLQYTFEKLTPRPSQVWLLDTVPGNLNRDVLKILKKLNHFMETHAHVVTTTDHVTKTLMNDYKIDKATAQWLASSFRNGRFDFDLQVAAALIADFERQDFVQQVKHVLDYGVKVDLVRAGRNLAWEMDENAHMVEQLELLTRDSHVAFRMHTLPDAGHWVHIDDLEGLLKVMNS